MKRSERISSIELNIFSTRAKIINTEMGGLALSLAYAAASTDAPRIFAFAAACIVLLWMAYRLRSYNRVCRLWREVKHPLTRPRNVWRHFPLFNAGWLALGLVSAGFVTKNGVFGFY